MFNFLDGFTHLSIVGSPAPFSRWDRTWCRHAGCSRMCLPCLEMGVLTLLHQPVVQLPPSVFDSLMEILRENRLAQLATIDQQRELTRYMRGLNEWLERGVHDRQAELHGVVARVDQLRGDIRAQAIPAQGAPGGDDSGSSDRSDGSPVILPDQAQGRPVIPPPPFRPWQPLGFQPYPVIPPDEDPRTFIPPRTDIPFIPDHLFPPMPPLLFQP
ncbi:hypothetical protein B0H11DRAFT_1970750 [Mycena galericulata]|nr:hypothetical protein B0H11DRAFT_1970750 [Mycena galericulata]